MQTLQFCRKKRGRQGSPSKGESDTAQGSHHSLQHRLGYQSPNSDPHFTAGPDPASPGDGFLLLLEKLLTSPPPAPPSSTASADAQSCSHLDMSWPGDSGLQQGPSSTISTIST